MKRLFRLAAGAGLVAMVACGSDRLPASPSAVTPGSPKAGAVFRGLEVVPVAPFTELGQTAQLVVRATFSDGSTRDVTRESLLTSSQPSVVTVSLSGLLTALGFGATTVTASYSQTTIKQRITSNPAGTVLIMGATREPGSGPLEGVSVRALPSGRLTVSAADGLFYFAKLADTTALVFEKAEYEPMHLAIRPETWAYDVPLQRIVRIDAGLAHAPVRLAAHDVSYPMEGEACAPCRKIRIMAPAAGTLRVMTALSPAEKRLILWRNGRRLAASEGTRLEAEFSIPGGETAIYIGGTEQVAPVHSEPYIALTITTTFRTGG